MNTIAVDAMGGDSAPVEIVKGAIKAKENGVKEQTVLIEFESLEKALQAYESPEYQEALKVLDGGADRDFRIF